MPSENSTVNVYELIKNGQYQDALLLSENEFENDKENISNLINYVSILLDLHLYPLAEDILNNRPSSEKDNQNVFLLFHDLYSRTGEIEKLKKMEKEHKHFESLNNHISIEDLSLDDSSLRPDKQYFREQLQDLIIYLIEKYPSEKRIFKKAHIKISNNYIDEGYFILKELAHSIEEKKIGYFILAELALVDKKYPIAKKRFNKLLKYFDEKWLIYNRLGDIELANENEIMAESYYVKAMEMNPDDLDTKIDLIRTYTLKGEIKKAKSLYNKTCEKFGDEKLQSIRKYIKRPTRNKHTGTTINGLVWHERGGDIMPIEITSTSPGDTEIFPTGNLGFSLLDSIRLAGEVARKSHYFHKHENKFNKNISINVPEMIVYKDGASAGLTLITGVLSEYMEKKIPTNIAFTGELTLSGSIRRIGGLKEKLIGAYMNGIKVVYIPKENFPDLLSIPSRVKSCLNIKMVNHYDEALTTLWKN